MAPTYQHYLRSILAIRAQGGVRVSATERLRPAPILVGRNAGKLAELGLELWAKRAWVDVPELKA